MASKTVSGITTTWQKLDTGSATVLTTQNIGFVDLFVQYSAAAPAATEEGFRLRPGQGLARNGEAGDLYARTTGSWKNGRVEVGE